MNRTVLAVMMLASALVGCGAEPEPTGAPASPDGRRCSRASATRCSPWTRAPVARWHASRSARMTLRWMPSTRRRAMPGPTTVSATDPVSGRRLRSIELSGPWVIPVAAGSTPEGAVSGDGKLLALAGPRDEGVSHFALLGTDLESQPRQFALRGHYEFDAMAPDGSAVFLSEIRGDGHYRVRAYDVESGRMRPQVVVEKTAVGLLMQGAPVTRAVDPTGSPVHTLYRGGPAGAFVHSLDTQHGTALCILLPDSKRAGPKWRLALDNRAGELHAFNRDLDTHYVIDPATGVVTPARPGAPLPSVEASSPDGARTYAIEARGTIAVQDSAGERIATLPSPSPEAELIAVRREMVDSAA